ncbi:Hypothetical predicted protein [Scomber scombrus]|uniref:Uncharacterized protein n=1 Tax=Scomber scombrus TaxID=13677 RepID=A0AAV1NRZ2_SCOSC
MKETEKRRRRREKDNMTKPQERACGVNQRQMKKGESGSRRKGDERRKTCLTFSVRRLKACEMNTFLLFKHLEEEEKNGNIRGKI